MRITNQMVTGNSLRNMQKSMSEVNKRTEQMTSGKKISQASDDPGAQAQDDSKTVRAVQGQKYTGRGVVA